MDRVPKYDGTGYEIEPTLTIQARYMCFKLLNEWRKAVDVTAAYHEPYESDRDATREVVNHEVNMN